jgi:hypothetical protein
MNDSGPRHHLKLMEMKGRLHVVGASGLEPMAVHHIGVRCGWARAASATTAPHCGACYVVVDAHLAHPVQVLGHHRDRGDVQCTRMSTADSWQVPLPPQRRLSSPMTGYIAGGCRKPLQPPWRWLASLPCQSASALQLLGWPDGQLQPTTSRKMIYSDA